MLNTMSEDVMIYGSSTAAELTDDALLNAASEDFMIHDSSTIAAIRSSEDQVIWHDCTCFHHIRRWGWFLVVVFASSRELWVKGLNRRFALIINRKALLTSNMKGTIQ